MHHHATTHIHDLTALSDSRLREYHRTVGAHHHLWLLVLAAHLHELLYLLALLHLHLHLALHLHLLLHLVLLHHHLLLASLGFHLHCLLLLLLHHLLHLHLLLLHSHRCLSLHHVHLLVELLHGQSHLVSRGRLRVLDLLLVVRRPEVDTVLNLCTITHL